MTVFNSEQYRPVVEPADTADLKPAAETHEGSTPSEPTKNVELISKIDWSGRYHLIMDKLLELPGAKEIVYKILATGPSIQSMFSKDLDAKKLTPKQDWESMMPATELPLEVGQKRIVFIDGIGDKDGVITRFNDTTCWFKIDGDGFEWEMEWDMPGMNGIGILVDGVEHKKIMAEEAISAENSAPSNA